MRYGPLLNAANGKDGTAIVQEQIKRLRDTMAPIHEYELIAANNAWERQRTCNKAGGRRIMRG